MSNAQLEKALLQDLQAFQRKKTSSRGKTQRRRTNSKQGTPPLGNGVALNYSKNQAIKSPSISASRNCCRIRHKEFISNISGTSSFTTSYFPVNPGQSATFPWLSRMAANWERYHFHACRFVLHARIATTESGSVLMAPDYDASDESPTTEQVMTTYRGCVETAPWKDLICVLNARDMYNATGEHFIRLDGDDSVELKLYDVASFYVGTVNGGSTNLWGKLWVEYDVELLIPQLPPSLQDFPAITSGGAFKRPGDATSYTLSYPFGGTGSSLSSMTPVSDSVQGFNPGRYPSGNNIWLDSTFVNDVELLISYVAQATFTTDDGNAYTLVQNVVSGDATFVDSDCVSILTGLVSGFTIIRAQYHIGSKNYTDASGTGGESRCNITWDLSNAAAGGMSSINGPEMQFATMPNGSGGTFFSDMFAMMEAAAIRKIKRRSQGIENSTPQRK